MKLIKHRLQLGTAALSGCSVLTYSLLASAQENPPPVFPQESIPAGLIELTDKEVVLSYSVLIFGLLVLCLQVYLLRRINATAQQIILTFTLSTIIIASLYLVTIGLSSEQIAPAFSLFGAIIGYLLGRESIRNELRAEHSSKKED